jgi:hypothetical protein
MMVGHVATCCVKSAHVKEFLLTTEGGCLVFSFRGGEKGGGGRAKQKVSDLGV